MVVPTCFMIAAWTYAVCVNFVPSYRNPADKIGAATIGLDDNGRKEASSDGDGDGKGDLEKNGGMTHKEIAS